MESNDKMRMTILHPGLKLGVFVPWRDVSAMTGEAILQEIMKVLQSNENFRIHDGQMTIQVTVVRLPVGSGQKPLHAGLYFESENMRKNKQSIVQINYTLQTPSTYIPQPVQQMPQKQQSKTQVIEVLLKEVNELRSRVKKLSQQRAQQQTIEIQPIQIPIRLDIMTNDQETSQNVGVGKATKKIKMTKKKC